MSKDAKTRAREHFDSGYNCAQSVLTALLEHRNLFFKQAPYVAAGLGGGIGREGQTCGTVTGAIMAIGVLVGKKTTDVAEHKKQTYELAEKFLNQFRRKHGSTLCCELTGYDIRDPNARAEAEKAGVFKNLCPGFVEDAVEIVLNLVPG